MGHLVVESGGNKGQLAYLVEAIGISCRGNLSFFPRSRRGRAEEVGGLAEAGEEPGQQQGETCRSAYLDRDAPGERLFLQLQQVLPHLVHHQLPLGCKDFSEYYVRLKN